MQLNHILTTLFITLAAAAPAKRCDYDTCANNCYALPDPDGISGCVLACQTSCPQKRAPEPIVVKKCDYDTCANNCYALPDPDGISGCVLGCQTSCPE
jgi:hypothetical protein